MNLMELTGQESGIIIRNEQIMVVNWGSNEGLPYLAPWGNDVVYLYDVIDLDEDLGEVDDIRLFLPGQISIDVDDSNVEVGLKNAEIVYDPNCEIFGLYKAEINAAIKAAEGSESKISYPLTSGKAFRLENGTIVVTPNGWN